MSNKEAGNQLTSFGFEPDHSNLTPFPLFFYPFDILAWANFHKNYTSYTIWDLKIAVNQLLSQIVFHFWFDNLACLLMRLLFGCFRFCQTKPKHQHIVRWQYCLLLMVTDVVYLPACLTWSWSTACFLLCFSRSTFQDMLLLFTLCILPEINPKFCQPHFIAKLK